ncbi:MAG TPA: potassium channel family protein [Vicinamibacterales bacterium]
MSPLSFVIGLSLIATVLWDAFETVILPRTVSRRWRLARVYFRGTWLPWRRVARSIENDGRRERFLAVYGPLSLTGLLMVWAVGLVLGFAALQWSFGSRLQTPTGPAHLADDIYMSGTTFFTLGLGDVHPVARTARILTVVEGGLGFGFLAVVIAYFPVLYQSFARREVRLTMLDAWAGSPPAAAEVLRRLAEASEIKALDPFLKDWEYWCSELLESHISYPAIAFFRSQHQRQSWVAALAAILDVSALVVVGIDGVPTWQAHVTFAIARHAAVDLLQVLNAPADAIADRLPSDDLEQLRRQLENAGLHPARSPAADARLLAMRRSYEPFVVGLGNFLMMPAPAWSRQGPAKDNWQTSPRGSTGHL